MRQRPTSRRATTMIEFVVIVSLTVMLLLGLAIAGLGVFRYQQVAAVAREASRWASVHGSQYSSDTGKPLITQTDVYNNAISPNATSLNLNQLTYSVTLPANNRVDTSTVVNSKLVVTQNTVKVTVNYHWIPEAYFGGLTMSSTSVSTMAY
jgi:hypothetical protein